MTKVSIQRCEEYELEEVKEQIKKGIDKLGGINNFVKKGSKVLLKPNLLVPALPKDAITTNPVVIEAIILLVQEAGGIVSLGDSPGFGSQKTLYEKTGMEEVCKRNNVKIADFDMRGDFKFKHNNSEKHFEFYKEVFDYDLIINVPKFKTHALTLFTGAVKNLFGIVPGLRKARYHLSHPNPEQFSALLLVIYNIFKPKLNIMDGIIGMEGNGPRNGVPRKVGLILVSDDALSLDAVACRIAGYKEDEVPFLKVARKLNLPQADLKNIELDVELDSLIIDDFKKPSTRIVMPELMQKILMNNFQAKPVVIFVKCTSCGTCAAVCPANAIHMKEVKGKRVPTFDYRKCIRCYCCSEMCPYDSIQNKPNGLMKLFSKK